MKSLKLFFDFFLFSNLFISLCAVAMTAETYLLAHSAINRLYILFVFASTFALYNLQRLFYTGKKFGDSKSERHRWIFEHRKLLLVLSAAASTGIAILIFFFPVKFILWFSLLGLISLSYFLPFTNLRSIPLVKAVLVALVWTCITYYYPLFITSLRVEDCQGGIARFFFLISLAVAFNIRDIEIDRKSSVKTLPVIFGAKPTKILCVIFLFGFSVLIIFLDYNMRIQIGLLFSALATVMFIFYARETRSEYFYSLWMDGMLILQCLLVWVAIKL